MKTALRLELAGIALWAANTYLPMDPKIKNILNVVVVIAVVLWLLTLFLGPIGGLSTIRVGR